MALGTIRPIALSHFVQECLSLMISHRCHSALYGCLVHDFLPEVSHGSLARVQVPARHSRCGASKALRARGSPPSHSILLDLNSSQMVQGIQRGFRRRAFGLLSRRLHPVPIVGEQGCHILAGRVSDLYFHWEVCHGDSTLERRCPWYSFP